MSHIRRDRRQCNAAPSGTRLGFFTYIYLSKISVASFNEREKYKPPEKKRRRWFVHTVLDVTASGTSLQRADHSTTVASSVRTSCYNVVHSRHIARIYLVVPPNWKKARTTIRCVGRFWCAHIAFAAVVSCCRCCCIYPRWKITFFSESGAQPRGIREVAPRGIRQDQERPIWPSTPPAEPA